MSIKNCLNLSTCDYLDNFIDFKVSNYNQFLMSLTFGSSNFRNLTAKFFFFVTYLVAASDASSC